MVKKMIRYATYNDIDFWLSLDKHISIENLKNMWMKNIVEFENGNVINLVEE